MIQISLTKEPSCSKTTCTLFAWNADFPFHQVHRPVRCFDRLRVESLKESGSELRVDRVGIGNTNGWSLRQSLRSSASRRRQMPDMSAQEKVCIGQLISTR